jgi:hypothetical protein
VPGDPTQAAEVEKNPNVENSDRAAKFPQDLLMELIGNEWRVAVWLFAGGFFALGSAGLIIFAIFGVFSPLDFGILIILLVIALFLFIAGLVWGNLIGGQS